MKRGQNGITETIPPTVTLMGRFFIFREVRHKGGIPDDLGF
jgi:hypothetical protein